MSRVKRVGAQAVEVSSLSAMTALESLERMRDEVLARVGAAHLSRRARGAQYRYDCDLANTLTAKVDALREVVYATRYRNGQQMRRRFKLVVEHEVES